ncbi:hypothetical protein COY27_01075 [Candidatus Woesearchaeota archaeon CG_4_10_14_0_2_um_filter_33_13]|nr:MAG: hypothetical protein COY27_01075 [Candidatus Woesearchaeota archaeon CG_4_10_14_0_2_um_filter_33_13]
MNTDLIAEAYQRLFPEKECPYITNLEYNRRLSDFNANIKLVYNSLSIHLNLQWKDIDNEIKIGLIQSLMLKVLKKRINTTNINLYNNFVKNIPILTPKTKSDPVLEESFHRTNHKFFQQTMEMPNLTWGTASKRKLASYNFHDDTVTISTLFQEARSEVLDYLMYHELLHKYHKFGHKNGRSSFHTRKFRDDENLYENKSKIEQEINWIIRESSKKKAKTSLFDFLRLK